MIIKLTVRSSLSLVLFAFVLICQPVFGQKPDIKKFNVEQTVKYLNELFAKYKIEQTIEVVNHERIIFKIRSGYLSIIGFNVADLSRGVTFGISPPGQSPAVSGWIALCYGASPPGNGRTCIAGRHFRPNEPPRTFLSDSFTINLIPKLENEPPPPREGDLGWSWEAFSHLTDLLISEIDPYTGHAKQ